MCTVTLFLQPKVSNRKKGVWVGFLFTDTLFFSGQKSKKNAIKYERSLRDSVPDENSLDTKEEEFSSKPPAEEQQIPDQGENTEEEEKRRERCRADQIQHKEVIHENIATSSKEQHDTEVR